jgi:hypothetical protein
MSFGVKLTSDDKIIMVNLDYWLNLIKEHIGAPGSTSLGVSVRVFPERIN